MGFVTRTFSLALLVIIINIFNANSWAQSSGVTANNARPIKLINSSVKACGSGFIYNNQIVTNYHVAESLCPQIPCSDLQIYSAEGALLAAQSYEITRRINAPAYDLALLLLKDGSFEKQNNFRTASELGAPAAASNISSYSFPGCGRMEVSPGKIISEIGSLYYRTDLALQHGSSGGAVFNSSGELVGIISESESVTDGLSAMLLGTRFKFTRIIPAEFLSEIFRSAPGELYVSQTESLLEFYLDAVLNNSGINRLEEGARFLSKLRALALKNLSSDNRSVSLLLAMDNYPNYIFSAEGLNIRQIGYTHTILALAASTEQNGLRSSFIRRIDKQGHDKIRQEITGIYPDGKESVLRIISQSENDSYPGSTFLLIQQILPAVILCMLAIIAYVFSIGLIIGNKNNALLKKSFNICSLTLIFPALTVLFLYLYY